MSASAFAPRVFINWPAFRRTFGVGVQNTLVYRWNFLLRTVFGIVPLAGMLFLWQAATASNGGRLGAYDFANMVTYFATVVFLENLISSTEDDWQIAADIRDGRLSALLLKPLNYLGYRLALYLSYRLAYIAVVGGPMLAVAWVLRQHLHFPGDATTWCAFALSTAMAAALQFLTAYLLGLVAFWVLEVSTLILITYSFEYFLSGTIFPLDLLPAWLQPFIPWSPFTYEMFFPVQVAMGRVQGAALWQGLAIQAGWVAIYYLAARLLWRAGVKKYQAVGG
jgi:ABC-2 type transport system permease protein